MKKILCFFIILSCGLSAFSISQKVSVGMDYNFFDEFCQIYDRSVNTKFHSLGVDLSYRYFNENLFINRGRKNQLGFWYGTNFNFPIRTEVIYNKNPISLVLGKEVESVFLMDNYIGATYEIKLFENLFLDLSLGEKLSFSNINRNTKESPKNIINFTAGIGSEVAISYFFDKFTISNLNFGLILGTKLNYDYYSAAQSFNPEKYGKYGVFSASPFFSFIMKF